MLKETSKEFRKFFLLQFTKELIRHTGTTEVFKLEKVLEDEFKTQKYPSTGKPAKEKIHEIINEREKELSSPEKEEKPLKQIKERIKLPQKPLIQRKTRPILRVPETKLPQTFQYLKPDKTKEIDLEKLNPLIQDPLVKSIECHGPEENITVKGNMGTRQTDIILNKEEIEQIIKKFSEAAKKPVHEGFFKTEAGRLIFSAIVSDLVGSKFIIRKMMYNPGLAP